MKKIDEKIIESINLYNSITKSGKIINYKKLNYNKLDSLDKINLITSFEEVFREDNLSFGNFEKDSGKIFKNFNCLKKHIKNGKKN